MGGEGEGERWMSIQLRPGHVLVCATQIRLDEELTDFLGSKLKQVPRGVSSRILWRGRLVRVPGFVAVGQRGGALLLLLLLLLLLSSTFRGDRLKLLATRG